MGGGRLGQGYIRVVNGNDGHAFLRLDVHLVLINLVVDVGGGLALVGDTSEIANIIQDTR